MEPEEVREIAKEEILRMFEEAGVRKIVHHELEEILWEMIRAERAKPLKEFLDGLRKDIDELEKVAESTAIELIEKLSTNEQFIGKVAEKFVEKVHDWDVRRVFEEVTKARKGKLYKIIDELIEKRKANIEKAVGEMIDRALEKVSEKVFARLIEDRLRLVLSSLETVERRVTEIEMKVRYLEERVTTRA